MQLFGVMSVLLLFVALCQCSDGPTFTYTSKFDDGTNFDITAKYCDGSPNESPWNEVTKEIDFSKVPTSGLRCDTATPGSRSKQASLLYEDEQLLYVFGGHGYDSTTHMDYMNDVWSYNYTTTQWAFHYGTTFHKAPGVTDKFGLNTIYNQGPAMSPPEAGVFDPKNRSRPGGREGSVMMTGEDGDKNAFYVFGGYGRVFGECCNTTNQLWEFNISTNQWRYWAGISPPYSWAGTETFVTTFVVGTGFVNEGQKLPFPLAGAAIGTRSDMVLWEPLDDSNPNLRIIFGGYFEANKAWNDVWELDLSKLGPPWPKNDDTQAYETAWLVRFKGPETISLYCRAANIEDEGDFHSLNVPAPRSGAYSWSYKLDIDLDLRTFFFGGYDNCRGKYLNDIWRYNYKMRSFMPYGLGKESQQYENQPSSYFSPGVYRPEGIPCGFSSPSNCVNETVLGEMKGYPGSRANGANFLFQRQGQFFLETFVLILFGQGYQKDGQRVGLLGDIWMLRLDKKDRWSWINKIDEVDDYGVWSGSTSTRRPSSRQGPVFFKTTEKYMMMNGHAIRDGVQGPTQDIWELSFTYDCFGRQIWEPEVCGGHGFCENENVCGCSYQYLQSVNCTEVKTNCYGMYDDQTGVCSGNGVCLEANKCVCKKGYSGLICDDDGPVQSKSFLNLLCWMCVVLIVFVLL